MAYLSKIMDLNLDPLNQHNIFFGRQLQHKMPSLLGQIAKELLALIPVLNPNA